MSWNSEAERRCDARPVPSLRRVALAAGSAAVLIACLAGAFTGAVAGPAAAATGRTAAAGQHGDGLKVTIDSVSPDIGRPGRAVTVTGQVSNDGNGTVQGLTADLRSSGSGLQYRGALDEYANGTSSADQQVTPAVNLPDLGPGRSEGFRMSFRPDDAGIQQFGVYPLAAEVNEATGATVTARTFLPFWPPSQQGVQKLKIAWVWPLIDQPRQGACPALLNNALAGSLDAASGGRLGGLLQAGRDNGHGARITWAVDPGLLADTDAMTSQYHVLEGPRCRNLRTVPANGVARQWLAGLSSTVSQGQGGQPVFTTPYADVDVAALTHAGLDTDLGNAFSAGRSTATSVLGQRLDRAGGGTLDGTAWPPGGAADSSVLDNLAVNGVRTAVLDSNEMPPENQVDYTPDAVTKVPSGVGSDVRVLLSDHTLTGVLGRSGAAAGNSAAQTEQWFLAETAMIAAEAPQLGRSVVVAPPPRWSPSQALADGLLSETTTAPWLQPEYLNDLTPAAAPASVARIPLSASQTSPSELGSRYLAAVKPIDASVQRFNSILSRPDPLYPEAVARAESSAWRGSGQEAGRDLTSQVGRYVADQEAKVRVLSSPGVTLSGARGNVPVSLINQLPRGYTATVKLEAAAEANKTVPAGRLTIGNKPGPFVQTVTIRAGESMTVRIPVHAQSAGLTDVDLRLLAPNGAPLSAKPTVLKVQSTPLGLVAEVITGVAVGVLVLTSLVRVVRRGLREGRPSPAGPARGGPAQAGEPPQQAPPADQQPGDQQEPSPSGNTQEPSWSGDLQQPLTGDLQQPPWPRAPHGSSPAMDSQEPSWSQDPQQPPWPGNPQQPWPGNPEEPSWSQDPQQPPWPGNPHRPWPGDPQEPSWSQDPQQPSWPGNPQQPPWPGNPPEQPWREDPQEPPWPGDPHQPWPGDPQEPSWSQDPQQPSWPGNPREPSQPGNPPEQPWPGPQEPPWPGDPHQPWPGDQQEPWPGDAQQGPSAPADRQHDPPPSAFTERGADQAGPAGPTGDLGAGGAGGASGDAFAAPDDGDQAGFSSGHGAGHEAGTVVTEDGRPASQHAQHFPEEPDEFADARPRAWPDTP